MGLLGSFNRENPLSHSVPDPFDRETGRFFPFSIPERARRKALKDSESMFAYCMARLLMPKRVPVKVGPDLLFQENTAILCYKDRTVDWTTDCIAHQALHTVDHDCLLSRRSLAVLLTRVGGWSANT